MGRALFYALCTMVVIFGAPIVVGVALYHGDYLAASLVVAVDVVCGGALVVAAT